MSNVDDDDDDVLEITMECLLLSLIFHYGFEC